MAQDTPGAPGHDLLDDAIGRLRAAKTSLGLLLARALEACHSRFLVFGSTLATLAAKVTDLEARDNIDWPTLEARLDSVDLAIRNLLKLEARCTGLDERYAETVGNLIERLEALEHRHEYPNEQRASVALLRAALQVLDPPLSARELLRRRSDGT